MVTHNIDTTHQIANGAQGEIVRIILDPHEDPKEQEGAQDVELSYPPACVLIQLNSYRLMSRRSGPGGHSDIPDRPIVPNFDAVCQ